MFISAKNHLTATVPAGSGCQRHLLHLGTRACVHNKAVSAISCLVTTMIACCLNRVVKSWVLNLNCRPGLDRPIPSACAAKNIRHRNINTTATIYSPLWRCQIMSGNPRHPVEPKYPKRIVGGGKVLCHHFLLLLISQTKNNNDLLLCDDTSELLKPFENGCYCVVEIRSWILEVTCCEFSSKFTPSHLTVWTV